jgi:hypothetical protein
MRKNLTTEYKDHFLRVLRASAVKIVFKERTYGQVTS